MTKKSNLVLTIVMTALFGIGGIALVIVSLIVNERDAFAVLLLLGITCLVLAIVILIPGLINNGKFKRREQNIATPGTIANKIADPANKFTRFTVVPDAAQQSKSQVTQNAISAVTFVFLGFGVFSTGKTTQEIFVSDDELIISSPKNMAWDDNMFTAARSCDVDHIEYAVAGKSERVTIRLVNGAWLVYDIAYAQADSATIRSVFDRFVNSAAANAANATATGTDEVFPEYDPSQDENVTVCPNCGVIVSPDARFCTNCGNKIE